MNPTKSSFGLTSKEAEERLKIYGKNVLLSNKVSALRVLLRQFTSPLIYLLIIASIISLLLSSLTDTFTVLTILVINALLGFYQEYRSEKFIEKLHNLIKKISTVRRDGKVVRIAEEDIVPDDIALIKAGDVIPADGLLFIANEVIMDESVMSGESLGVTKEAGGKVLAGTTIVHGYGEFKVTETGMKTELGKIAYLTEKTRKVSKYEKSISEMSRFLMQVTLAILALIFLVNLLLKGITIPNAINFLLFTTALAISIVPEALPVIATLTLSRGAFGLAKKHVVVKKLPSVEDLGNIDVLCTDKTGTITKNELTVKEIVSDDKKKLFYYVMPLLESGNPLDDAIRNSVPVDIEKTKLVESFPFDPVKRRRWGLVKEKTRLSLVVFGSAEEVANLSTNTSKKRIITKIKKIESSGLRVLAAGYKTVNTNFSFKKDFEDDKLTFLGYLLIFDPIRETAKETIALAEKLNVQIKILTGDSIGVATYIAKEIGLIGGNQDCYLGTDLEKLPDEKFDEVCREGIVFARVKPEQKYRIIESLKKDFVIGYQGDGINDAPALKSANVGIAVNNATDVAKEAADIILLKKDLRVIVDGIVGGRKIFKNIDKYIKHTMVSNWGNFFAVAAISLFVDFLPLLPIQILLTSLFSDLPLLASSTDTVDTSELQKPAKYNILDLVTLPLVLGIVTAIFNILFFVAFYHQPIETLRTIWFMFINFTSLVVIFSVRKNDWMTKGILPSKTLALSILGAFMAAFILPYTNKVANIFYIQKISFGLNLFIVLTVIFYLAVLDTAKVIYYKYRYGKANS